MKVGIMQPYFVPYLGYWQLLNAVDRYVIYDDVNFIKGGWINRNRILYQGEPKYFNVKMQGASPNKLINEVLVDPAEEWRRSALALLAQAYKKAPNFDQAYSLAERIFSCQDTNLARFLHNSIQCVCALLQINTKIYLASELQNNRSCGLHAQDRVIAICKELGADVYYNAIGGQALYSKQDFAGNGIELKFLQTELQPYAQFGQQFVPGLSILDVLMFNSVEMVRTFLEQYQLI